MMHFSDAADAAIAMLNDLPEPSFDDVFTVTVGKLEYCFSQNKERVSGYVTFKHNEKEYLIGGKQNQFT